MPSTKVGSNSKSIRVNPDGGFTVNGSPFHVDKKYEPIDAIGQGSYGVVCSARNTKTGEKVAIKKIKPMAGDEWDATHTLREIRLMRCLGEHENIISLKDLSINKANDELYMMMELVDTDLHRLIQSSTKLSDSHIRVIMYQLLSAVNMMHQNGILHRDLKPGNLLVNKDCELKITDFGFARMMPKMSGATEDVAKPFCPMTEYVVTRWYRSPELMLAPNGLYDGAIDMWSCGCILAELLNRRPLFPGNDFMEQLTRVFKIIPIPSKEKRSYSIEKDALHFIESVPSIGPDAFTKAFKTATSDALDLLKNLLCFNPCERLSAVQALQHPFFKGIEQEWGKIKLIQLKEPLSCAFTFENKKTPLDTLKGYIGDEVERFREKERSLMVKTTSQKPEKKEENNKSDSDVDADVEIEKKELSKARSTKQQKPTEQPEKEESNNSQMQSQSNNEGFQIKGCTFHVDSRFEPISVLGEGTYGVVCCALDKETNQKVAIKKITPMATDSWDGKHTLREVRLMRYFGSHPNITGIRHLSSYEDELYIMMDIADTDLHRLIQSKTVLTTRHIEAILYQILAGAKALHSNNVLHRDLKPGNILVSRSCDVKIADFGLSRVALPKNNWLAENPTRTEANAKPFMTEYVVTRWYRPPEIMLAPNGIYTSAVDMWSIGCIFGELLNRRPLFPGTDFVDQLVKVFGVVPLPEHLSYPMESDARAFLSSLPKCNKHALSHLCLTASSDALDLLSKLLAVDPAERITAAQALEHPFFKQVRQDLSVPMDFTVDTNFSLDFDVHEYSIEKLRELIINEVANYDENNSTTSVSQSVTGKATAVTTKTAVTAKAVPARTTARDSSDSEGSLKSESIIEKAENILSKYKDNESRYNTRSTISSCEDTEEEEQKIPEAKRSSWKNNHRSSLKKTVTDITNSVFKLLSKNEKHITVHTKAISEREKSKTENCSERSDNLEISKSLKTGKRAIKSSHGTRKAQTQLPAQWERKLDPKTGRLYYLNVATQKLYTHIPETSKNHRDE